MEVNSKLSHAYMDVWVPTACRRVVTSEARCEEQESIGLATTYKDKLQATPIREKFQNKAKLPTNAKRSVPSLAVVQRFDCNACMHERYML